MNDADLKTRARAEREKRIKILQACTCAYPIRNLRNRSGHAGECPAHALWLELHPLA